MEILGGIKWMVVFFISLVWIYMAARMIGRAFAHTIEELWGIKPTNFKKEKKDGEEKEQKKE